MMTIGIVARAIFGQIGKILTYAIDHWRVFLPLLVLCLALWQYNRVVEQRDNARNELQNYREQVAEAKRQRRVLNMVIEQRLQLELSRINTAHDSQMSTLLEKYNDALKDKTAAVATAADLRRQLRDTLTAATAARMPEDRARLVGPTCGGRDSDSTNSGYDAEAYIDTLEYAAADTTLSYNTLRQRCEAAIAAVNGVR